MKGNCYNPYAARSIAVSCFFNCQRREYYSSNLIVFYSCLNEKFLDKLLIPRLIIVFNQKNTLYSISLEILGIRL